jgi:hypothetical membrane protein
MSRRIWLAAGIASPLLYIAADLIAGLRWQGYSFRDQTISELGAIGAPSASLFGALLVIVYVLMIAFGLGVWTVADRRGRLRLVGALLVGLGVVAVAMGPFSAMQMRGTEQGFTGRMHILLVAVGVLLILAAMAFAAASLGRRFLLYTVVTIVVMLAFGVWSGTEAPRIEQDLPTPWVGVKERICVYSYQLWFIVLALTLLRRTSRAAESPASRATRVPPGFQVG